MDVKQFSLPHASLSEIRLARKICRQTGLINSTSCMAYSQSSWLCNETRFSPRIGFLASTPRPAVLATVSRQRVLHLLDNRSQDLNALLDLPNAQGGIAHDKPHAIDVAFVRLPLVKGRDQVQP